MAIKDILESWQAHVSTRMVSPLFGALILSWFAWNYRVPFVLFSELPITESFAYIDKVIYPNQIVRWTWGAVFPILTALSYVYLFWWPSNKVLEFTHRQRKLMLENLKLIDGISLLSKQESDQIREQMAQAYNTAQMERTSLHEESGRLRSSRDELQSQLTATQKSLIQAQAQLAVSIGNNVDPNVQAYLLSRSFRLYFNTSLPEAQGAKLITFGRNGEIYQGRNQNESQWELEGGFLTIRNEAGDVYSRFALEATNAYFRSQNEGLPAQSEQFIMPV